MLFYIANEFSDMTILRILRCRDCLDGSIIRSTAAIKTNTSDHQGHFKNNKNKINKHKQQTLHYMPILKALENGNFSVYTVRLFFSCEECHSDFKTCSLKVIATKISK